MCARLMALRNELLMLQVVCFVFQSYVLLAIVIFLPYISQILKWCRNKAIGKHGFYHNQ